MTDLITKDWQDDILIISINRSDRRNAVNQKTAEAMADAFEEFDKDEDLKVAILTGGSDVFCAGADLKAISEGEGANRVDPPPTGDDFDRFDRGPMGPSRFYLSKPVIAAIEGPAVAGGLELALWCDLRVVAEDSVLGVYCRRWGVPLVDGGTVRLPRLVGHSRAMDLILTGRGVGADEALQMGLANRIAPSGMALSTAIDLAEQIARFPQICMRHDRMSAIEQWDLPFDEAMANEIEHGMHALRSQEAREGASRFAAGKGRGGDFSKI